ncbi:unnamed protein product [Macrosiphum euphorbiae]|uniref:Nucleic-acid-binding protein from transposon X-element n=1 Tax=Macrosiphum euphorbiae TaxID=13131 RepID=A0AAV0WM61_9HEMI|nr:unnamed protein product [Macrosiphum euphorbiae]
MKAVPIDSITVKAFRNDSVKIQCTDSEMFRIVQKYFKNTETEFFTFPSPEEKTLRVVIRGLPTDYSDIELTEKLVSKGYEISAVRQFVNAGKKLPLHMVSLPNNPASKSIFRESSFFYISVKVEAYKATNLAQCFKCQRFGHSSIYCGFTPRCVKCARSHLAKDCPKTLEQTPKCINYEGPHTANYKQCPEFLKTKAAKQASLPTFNQQRVQPTICQPPATITPPSNEDALIRPQSYATVVGPKPSKLSSQSVNPEAIQLLTNLLSELTASSANIRDVLISTLIALIPLLLSHNV